MSRASGGHGLAFSFNMRVFQSLAFGFDLKLRRCIDKCCAFPRWSDRLSPDLVTSREDGPPERKVELGALDCLFTLNKYVISVKRS